MRIQDDRQPTKPLTFADLEPGDVFAWQDAPFVMIKHDLDGYVDVSNGSLVEETGQPNRPVIRLDATLHIHGEA